MESSLLYVSRMIQQPILWFLVSTALALLKWLPLDSTIISLLGAREPLFPYHRETAGGGNGTPWDSAHY